MVQHVSDEVVSAVLDGAEACVREAGITSTTMDEIVDRSGVARATLYRHAGTRNDILLALVRRDIDRLHADLVRRLVPGAPLDEVLVEGILHVLDLVRRSPVLHELLADPTVLAAEVTEQAMEALAGRLEAFVAPLFGDGSPRVRDGLEPGIAVEFLVRTIVSMLTLDGGRRATRAHRRRYLRQTVVPVFVPDRST